MAVESTTSQERATPSESTKTFERIRTMRQPNKRRRHIWRDYNGPGKPITEAQLIELLAEYGIKPRVAADGSTYFLREDFEGVWKHLGIDQPKRQH